MSNLTQRFKLFAAGCLRQPAATARSYAVRRPISITPQAPLLQNGLNESLKRTLYSLTRVRRRRLVRAAQNNLLHTSSVIKHLKGHGKRDAAADYEEGRRITIIGLISNVVLSIGSTLLHGAKAQFGVPRSRKNFAAQAAAIAGVVGNSAALVADAVHSLGDLASDFVTLYTHRLSRSHSVDPKTYPYGYGKFEALGTFLVSLLLVASGIGVGWNSGLELLAGDAAAPPTQIALWAAAISLVIKEVLFQITMRVAKKQNSLVLEANAWHHRSDAISSILAFVGVGGQMLGIPYCDSLAGIAVAGIIVQAGWPLLKVSTHELVDRHTFPDIFQVIEHVALEQDPNHVALTQVRARKNGPNYAVDVRISVSATHYKNSRDVDDLRLRMRDEIVEHYADVNDIVVEISLVDDDEILKHKKMRAEENARCPPPPLPWERPHRGPDHDITYHESKQ